MPRVHRQYASYQPHQAARSPPRILAGKIMWLPKQEQLDLDLGIDDGCYNHPVVVLSAFTEDDKVIVLLVRTMRNQPLAL